MPHESPADAADDSPAQAAFYRMILDHSADLVILSDAALRATYSSPSAQTVLGYSSPELRELSARDLIHPDNLDDFLRSMEKLGADFTWVSLTFRARRKDGAYVWLEGSYRYVPENDGRLGVLRDVTVRRRLEDALLTSNAKLTATAQTLEDLVDHDGLTSLWNRKRFDAVLKEEFLRARRQESWLALVLIDIDGFAAFDRRFGSPAAEQVLLQLATIARKTMLRPGDHLSRYGHDQVAAILPNTDASGATVPAEKIRASMARLGLANPDAAQGVVTVSIGISAVLPISSRDSSKALLGDAEAALKLAETGGGNVVCCVPKIERVARPGKSAQAPARRRSGWGGRAAPRLP